MTKSRQLKTTRRTRPYRGRRRGRRAADGRHGPKAAPAIRKKVN